LTNQIPAQPAGPRFYRRRPWNIILPVVAVLAIVGGALGFALSSSNGSTGTPGASATPSSSSSAGGTVLAAACNENPTLPTNWLAYTFPAPANSSAAFSYITPVQEAGLNVPVYTGAYVQLSDLVKWVKAVQCSGMSAMVDPDPVFDTLGNSAAQTYIRQLAVNPTLKMFVVMADEVGNGSPSVVNARVTAIRGAGTNLPIVVVSDQQDTVLSGNVTQTRLYNNASFNVIGYYPFTGSAKYGDESTLPMDAQTEQAINGSHAVGAVQALWWWKSDPATTAYFGFLNQGPGPQDVVRMIRVQMGIGPHPMIIVDLEAVRGSAAGTVDDVPGHVVPVITAVRVAFTSFGH